MFRFAKDSTHWRLSILDTFKKCHSLVDAYDVYDQLLGYYNDSMQDDLFMISRDGWMPKLIEPAKKSPKWTDLTCDLLPVSLAVQVLLPDLKRQFDTKTAELANVQEQMNTMIEEDEGYLDDSVFYGKRNAANIKKKQKEANQPDMQGVYSKEQRDLWQQFLDLLEKEKSIKAEIKVLDAKLYKEIKRVYAELTEDNARNVIVNDRWIADITARINNEMQIAMHRIVAEVNDMHNRYEYTDVQLRLLFGIKETAVQDHLKEMGFELNETWPEL